MGPTPTPGGLPSDGTPLPAPAHRAAAGPTALFRNTKAAGAAVGGVRNMLLEWCRAMTRSYEVRGGRGWPCGAGARERRGLGACF